MRVKFKLNYLYQGQNSPFLHAADAGYFREHGIDCSFVEGFSSSLVTRALLEDEADIGFGDVSSVFEHRLRTGRDDIVCLMPVYERSPCCLGYIPQDGRLLALRDIAGNTLCGPNGDTSARLLPMLLARNDLPADDYTYLGVQPEERDRLVAEGKVLAATCFDATLKFAMEMRGHDVSRLQFLYFADHGLDPYSGAVIAKASLLARYPDLGGILRDICRRAWYDCYDNPDLGVEAVMRRAPELERRIVRNQLSWILERQIFPNGLLPMRFDLDGTKMSDTLKCALFGVKGVPPRDSDDLIRQVCPV